MSIKKMADSGYEESCADETGIGEPGEDGAAEEETDDGMDHLSGTYSMLDLEWRDAYNIGIPEIDYQHRYFLRLIRRIAYVMVDGHDAEYCRRVLMELVYYARFHFYSEENMMMHYNYSHLERHRDLHMDLLDLLTNKINSVDDGIIEHHNLIRFLLQWFVHHSMEEDKKIASCLHDYSSKQCGAGSNSLIGNEIDSGIDDILD